MITPNPSHPPPLPLNSIDQPAAPSYPSDRRPSGPHCLAGGGQRGAKRSTDEAKNKAEELTGKDAPGQATDDELKTEGKTDQAKGNLKQAGNKIKDAFT